MTAARRRDALDWASEAVKAHGYELAQAFVEADKRGDWRASEALMNRIYGKPEAAVVAHVPSNPVTDVIRSLSLEEKLELLRSLRKR
jgi:hypothetical protein